MKVINSLVLILIALSTFGQNNHHITDSTKVWNTLSYGAWAWNIMHCGGTKTHQIGDEVIFNNTVFNIVLETEDNLGKDWNQVGYLREDLASGQVFFSAEDTENIGLIYDFGLSIGDSVEIDNFYLGAENILLV
jgi:hypothetical protein